jgi:hypothetical protein
MEAGPVISGVGLDVQHSRTMIVVREGARQLPVGDGQRRLVPNALDGPRWGSTAAEAILGGGSPDAAWLSRWRTDPWSQPFLTGVHDRLTAFLGQVRPVHSNGYFVYLSTAHDTPLDALDRCASAGLTDTFAVESGEALICRWLAESAAGDWKGTVAAVACGENWTSATPYAVDRSDDRITVTRTGPAVSRAVGSGPWCFELAADVLERCREGVPATALLPLLDGVLELASTLRGRDTAEWTGPLTDQLFAPLTFTHSELAARPSVERVASAARELIRTTSTAPELVIVGGPGAVWPFIGEALRDFGPVWQSQEPEQDLAIGAAWWPVLEPFFADVPAPALLPGRTAEPAGQVPVDDQDQPPPPWLR